MARVVVSSVTSTMRLNEVSAPEEMGVTAARVALRHGEAHVFLFHVTLCVCRGVSAVADEATVSSQAYCKSHD